MSTHRPATDNSTVRESIVIRPNRSLSPGGIAGVFLAYVGVVSTIVAGFWVAGAWMILPFAGLELAMLGALCGWMYQHGGDCETVAVIGDRLRISKRSGGRVSHREFLRYWARVWLQPGAHEWHPSRLLLGSHGRFIEVASDVTEEARRALAKDLQAMIRQMN